MELLPAISAYGTSTVNVTTMDGTYNHIISTQGTSSMCSYHRQNAIALCSTMNGTSSRTFSITRSNCSVFYHERNIFSHVFLLHRATTLCSTMNGTSSRTFSITQSNCSVFYHERNIFSHIFYYTEQLLCVLP